MLADLGRARGDLDREARGERARVDLEHDLQPVRVQRGHHLPELVSGARPASLDAVAHRLVAFAPGVAFLDQPLVDVHVVDVERGERAAVARDLDRALHQLDQPHQILVGQLTLARGHA